MNIIESILNTSEQMSLMIVVIAATSAFWLLSIAFAISYVKKELGRAQRVIEGLQGEIQHYRTGGMATSESMGKRVAVVYAAATAITPMHWGIAETKRDGNFLRPAKTDTRLFFRFETFENITEFDALDLALPMDGEVVMDSIELTSNKQQSKTSS